MRECANAAAMLRLTSRCTVPSATRADRKRRTGLACAALRAAV